MRRGMIRRLRERLADLGDRWIDLKDRKVPELEAKVEALRQKLAAALVRIRELEGFLRDESSGGGD